ncbi:MAG: HDOD domain-containing protein [Gemmatimonadota bacterium]
MKVLLAEDSAGMRKIIGTMLKGMGYGDVVTAGNGEEALVILRQVKVDLLLTNWTMPVMDGLELVRRLRLMSDYAQLPVLMFTSRASRRDVVAALKVGVDDYIRKPFTPSDLKAHLDGILADRADRQIDQLEKGLDHVRQGDAHPLIVIGDAAHTREQLRRPENQGVLDFLAAAAAGVGRINARGGDLRVGLLTSSNSTDITRYVRALGPRLKTLFLSTRLPGGGVTLARLIGVNKRSDVSVFLVCESRREIPDQVRLGLDRMGITIFERQRLSGDSVERLVDEHVLAKVHQPRPSELPAPDELRRRLETDIRLAANLPVMPQVFHQIVGLARDPDSDIQQWIDAIEADPLSRAQVIHRARSPLYGFQGDIRETSKAVILLGKNAVKEAIVSKAVQRAFEEVQEDRFSVEEYWLHSVAVGVVARLLSYSHDGIRRSPEQQKEWDRFSLTDEAVAALARLDLADRLSLVHHEDPFLGGMVHDIGKVALAHAYPGFYPLVAEELVAKGWQIPMRYAEETFAGGADHALVGRILAQGWGLGDDVCRVVEQHHDPRPGDAYVGLVSLANLVVGGLYPYPQVARYPLVELLKAGPHGAAGGAAKEEARTALPLFAPTALLDELGIALDALVDLTRLLAPSVRKITEAFREKAGESKGAAGAG